MSKIKTEDLTPQQYRALTEIVAGYSNATVAKNSSVTIKTIESWRKLPKFKELLRDALSQCFDAAVAELVLHSQNAAKELNRIALDPDTPSRVKVSAIVAIFTFASKAKDAHLESRLEQLEKAIEYATIDTQATAIREYFPEESEETE
jgi:hypothetical protein